MSLRTRSFNNEATTSSYDTYAANAKLSTKQASSLRYITFQCASVPEFLKDKTIQGVYNNIIKNQSHLDIDASPHPQCGTQYPAGDCGYRRKFLTECRCTTLSRLLAPIVRKKYEDKVIATLSQILKDKKMSPFSNQPFELNIAVFGSSFLLGEEILLFKCIDMLKQSGAKGTIRLFYVDNCYANLIQQSDYSGKNQTQEKNLIEQFIRETSQSLPEGIRVEGAFFDHTEKYIQAAKQNNHFQHDLLIGADTDKADKAMASMMQVQKTAKYKPITLVKILKGLKKEAAALCSLESSGSTSNCIDPTTGKLIDSEAPNLKTRREIDYAPWIYGGTAAAVVITILVILLVTKPWQKK